MGTCNVSYCCILNFLVVISPAERDAMLTPAQIFIDSTTKTHMEWRKKETYCSFVDNQLSRLPMNPQQREKKSCLVMYLQYMIFFHRLKAYDLRKKGKYWGSFFAVKEAEKSCQESFLETKVTLPSAFIYFIFAFETNDNIFSAQKFLVYRPTCRQLWRKNFYRNLPFLWQKSRNLLWGKVGEFTLKQIREIEQY